MEWQKHLQMIRPKYMNRSYDSKSKKQTTHQKWADKLSEQTFSRRHTDGQRAHVNTVNIYKNADQTCDELLPHTSWKGYQQNLQVINAGEGMEKREPSDTIGTCVLQSYLTVSESMECSPPGSSVHEILQARILEWVVMPSSRASSPPRD